MTAVIVTRHTAGAYSAEREGLTVDIFRNGVLCRCHGQWIASATWDRHCVTDPLMTWAEAKEQAIGMLADALANRSTPPPSGRAVSHQRQRGCTEPPPAGSGECWDGLDGTCVEGGICGGWPEPCGGCCQCLGGCMREYHG